MKYHVTSRIELEADSPEAAAREADRLLQTNRPREYDVTPAGGKTVFVRVINGDATRVA